MLGVLSGIVDLVTGRFAMPALLALSGILALGCVVAPCRSEAAHRIARTPGAHPLWLLLPVGGLFLTSPLGTDLLGLDSIPVWLGKLPPAMWLSLQAAFVIGQLGLTIHIGRRHRAWPWVVWPLAFVLGLVTSAIVVTDIAMVAGPMVK